MSEPAIHIRGIGKMYQIGKGRTTNSLREALHETLLKPVEGISQRLTGHSNFATTRVPQDSFWALQEVSFDVQAGQVLGLIGSNGSGKSTLLKILARITRPTTGYFEIRGRMGALLEVGTGFHPDLTGRENVYLNGSILGMRRPTIAAKFDSIVDFAGVEQFIDTPMKYYSSGMYVRLAFAVAVHLETEILLLDEVLAVGDISFQKKSFEKIKSITQDGRTVIMVSHALPWLVQLCSTVLWLDKGQIVTLGETSEVVESYKKAEYARQ